MHLFTLKAAIAVMYALAGLELIAFPIPSEAATFRLMKRRADAGGRRSAAVPGNPACRTPAVFRYLAVSGYLVMFCFFMIPLVWLFFPGISGYLLILTKAFEVPRVWAAVLLILTGSCLTLYAVLGLHRFRIGLTDEGGVKQDGAYRISRNPQVLGNHLAGLGILLAFPGLVMVLLFGVCVIHMHLKIMIEEDYLNRTIGAPYKKYKTQTGRYLGAGAKWKQGVTLGQGQRGNGQSSAGR
jgi:protein-S-isoprenylcysteine O-methyltransferase Ste14